MSWIRHLHHLFHSHHCEHDVPTPWTRWLSISERPQLGTRQCPGSFVRHLFARQLKAGRLFGEGTVRGERAALLLSVSLLLASCLLLPVPIQAGQLAIVIDDLGYQPLPLTFRTLPAEISISVLPDTPYATATSHEATRQQRDVLLHMPMEPSRAAPLERTTLTSRMAKAEFQQTLRQALRKVPDAFAVNNHMGSALTQNTQAMNWVMEVLAHQHLAFLDSRTTIHSVALTAAHTYQVPALKRHIFLDHQPTETFISQQLQRAIYQAQQQGAVIAIGHPHPVTLATLQNRLPTLAAEGITLVRLSALYAADQPPSGATP